MAAGDPTECRVAAAFAAASAAAAATAAAAAAAAIPFRASEAPILRAVTETGLSLVSLQNVSLLRRDWVAGVKRPVALRLGGAFSHHERSATHANAVYLILSVIIGMSTKSRQFCAWLSLDFLPSDIVIA